MAIRTQNGNVLLRYGKVSCSCCEELPDLPNPPSEAACLKASQFFLPSNYPPQEGLSTVAGGYFTFHLTNAEYLFYTTTPLAQIQETYTASVAMRQTWPTIGPSPLLLDFAVQIDHEQTYTRGQDETVNTALGTNIATFGGCGLRLVKRLPYLPNSQVTAQVAISGLYTNCSVPIGNEPTITPLTGTSHTFTVIVIFIEDDRDIPDSQKTHLMLFGAEFIVMGVTTILLDPLSNNASTNRIFDSNTLFRYTVFQPEIGTVTASNSSVTIFGRNVPVFSPLAIFNYWKPSYSCRLATTQSPALSNLNFNMTYTLEFLSNPP